jgi:hypothetical protein
MSMGEMSDSVLKMGSVKVRNTVFSSACHWSLNIAPHPFVFLGMKRAPQPPALLQSSYRQIDVLNGLRWALEGMKTQVKKVSDDGPSEQFF